MPPKKKGQNKKNKGKQESVWPKYNGGGLIQEEEPTLKTGSWWNTGAQVFSLRSAGYLKDRKKQPSASHTHEIVAVEVLDYAEPIFDIGRKLLPLRKFLEANSKEDFFIMNRSVPWKGGTSRNVILVARRVVAVGEDPPADRAWSRFIEGDAKYRDLRLKYCCKLVKAPWLLTKLVDTLGGQRPVIMGKGYLAQQHFTGANYVEIDVDIGSSAVARQIASSVLGYCNIFVIEEAFVIEGQLEDELPERAVMGISFRAVDTTECAVPLLPKDYVVMGEEGESGKEEGKEGEGEKESIFEGTSGA
jgi:hypothetical protein